MGTYMVKHYGTGVGTVNSSAPIGEGDGPGGDLEIFHPTGLVMNIQPVPDGFDVWMTVERSTVQVLPGTAGYPIIEVRTKAKRPAPRPDRFGSTDPGEVTVEG